MSGIAYLSVGGSLPSLPHGRLSLKGYPNDTAAWLVFAIGATNNAALLAALPLQPIGLEPFMRFVVGHASYLFII